MEKKKTIPQRTKIPKEKLEKVAQIAKAMQESRTILVASTKKLPSSQFHQIKKSLRGKANICVAKKSLILRAIDETKNPSLQGLKEDIKADVALFFSEIDPFDLAGMLADNQSPVKAKAGDIALGDITIEPGPTDLPPGPAISELSGVGLKVAVEGGKLTIKQGATVAKAGEPIKENVASVLGKLNISPLKVGFEPLAVYDGNEKKIYRNIKIDKKGTLAGLKEAISKALGFAVNIKYVTKETLSYFLAKASAEEKVIEALVNKQASSNETNDKNGKEEK